VKTGVLVLRQTLHRAAFSLFGLWVSQEFYENYKLFPKAKKKHIFKLFWSSVHPLMDPGVKGTW
jgi:hypothetical protein